MAFARRRGCRLFLLPACHGLARIRDQYALAIPLSMRGEASVTKHDIRQAGNSTKTGTSPEICYACGNE